MLLPSMNILAASATMLSPEELGWLVVVTSMVLALTFCLGVCMALWCRRVSGRTKGVAPVTVLDPSREKKGLPPSPAALILPSVTRSEFGSEPRTPTSSLTAHTAHSRPQWPPTKATHSPSLYSYTGTQLSSVPSAYLPLPSKYATTHVPSSSYNRRLWGPGTRYPTGDAKVPAVPATLTYMPQPRSEQRSVSFDSWSSGSVGKHYDDLLSDRDVEYYKGSSHGGHTAGVSSDYGTELDITRGRGVVNTRDNISCHGAPVRGVPSNDDIGKGLNGRGDGGRSISYAYGIDGRWQPGSRFGNFDTKVINPYLDNSENEIELLSKFQSVKNRTIQGDQHRPLAQHKEQLSLTSRSPILGTSRYGSQYGANISTDITLSTGLRLAQIPYISSSIGSVRNRDSRSPISFETKFGRSTSTVGSIENLGMVSSFSGRSVKSLTDEAQDTAVVLSMEDEIMARSCTDTGAAAKPTHNPLLDHIVTQGVAQLSQNPRMGTLGAIELQMEYRAVQQQLVMTVVAAVDLPQRFRSKETQLYVKILVGGTARYSTPCVPGCACPVFCSTLVHRLPSTRLQRTNVRFSVCQLDGRNRRVVAGFVSLRLPQLWPILHLPPTPLTHDLAPRDLLLPLRDTTPDHQVSWGGTISLGLVWLVEEPSMEGKLIVSTLTLQGLSQDAIADAQTTLVYVKVSVYKGGALALSHRSTAVPLHRQRTLLLHLLELTVPLMRNRGGSGGSGERESGEGDRATGGGVISSLEKRCDSGIAGGSVAGDVPLPMETLATGDGDGLVGNGGGPSRDHLSEDITVVGDLKNVTTMIVGPSVGISSSGKSNTAVPGASDVVSSIVETPRRESTPSLMIPSTSLLSPTYSPLEHETIDEGDNEDPTSSDVTIRPHLSEVQDKKTSEEDKSSASGITSGDDISLKSRDYLGSKDSLPNTIKLEEMSITVEKIERTSQSEKDLALFCNKRRNDRPHQERTELNGHYQYIEEDVKSKTKPTPVTTQASTTTTTTTDGQPSASKNDQQDKEQPPPQPPHPQTQQGQQQQRQQQEVEEGELVLLVLSVRAKSLKRGGRCVLGSAQFGNEASTEAGRAHWRRASAADPSVAAAGTHHLYHHPPPP